MADIYDTEIAVAAIDLLGIKALSSRGDESMAVMDALSRFVRNASFRGVFNEGSDTRHVDMFTAEMYFGDSVYLFADRNMPLEEQVQWLIARVATLIGVGLWYSPRFMVRAAIAVGDLRTRTVQSDGQPHEIRIGTAMIRAHQLQECQDWIGAAVYPGTPISAGVQNWISELPVPLKKPEFFTEPPTAVNWVW